MHLSNQAQKLKDFLVSETNIYDITFHKVAEVKYKEVSKHTKDKGTLDAYIISNSKEISDETNKILDETCKEIVSRGDYRYVFTQIGLFSLFLVPPLYPLIRYSIRIYQETQFNIFEFSVCIVGVLLLMCLFFAAAYSVFKITFTSKATTKNK